MVLELTQIYPLWDSAPEQQLEGHQLQNGSGRNDWKWSERQASSIVPSPTFPPHTAPQSSNSILGIPSTWFTYVVLPRQSHSIKLTRVLLYNRPRY